MNERQERSVSPFETSTHKTLDISFEGMLSDVSASVDGINEVKKRTIELLSKNEELKILADQYEEFWAVLSKISEFSNIPRPEENETAIELVSRIQNIRALQQNLWVNFGSGRSPRV